MARPTKRPVIIKVSKGRYDKSINNGAVYTDVRFFASTYGYSAPCDTKEEVQAAIKLSKSLILAKGHMPVVDNQLEARTLFNYGN